MRTTDTGMSGIDGPAPSEARLSELRLKALIEASPEVVYRMSADWGEMKELAGGGFLPDTNDSSRAWLMDYIPDQDQAVVSAAIDKAIQTKTLFSLEHRVRRVDGGIGWTLSRAVPILDDDGEILEWAGAASDVTARREAEQQLRDLNASLEDRIKERSASLHLYRNIVESNASPVVAFDHNLRVIAFNRAHGQDWLRVFGKEAQIGDVMPDLVPADQAQSLRKFMRRALEGESFVIKAVFGDPARCQPTWSVTYNPLRDESGVIVGAFHHAVDISTQVRAETELAETQEVLRQSQKMEAVGQLTGGIAHDFNNLLTVIRGSVDLLRRDSLTPERRGRYIDAIGDTAERAAKLTSQLLSFARRQALKPELLNIENSIERIFDMLDTVTGSQVRVTIEVLDSPCIVRADAGQFETALVNMAANARDAMDGRGTLTITLDCAREMPSIRGHGGSPGPFVTLQLHDTGSGIAADDLQRIFEPFFTTKDVGKGTGLGLSQVFGFAKQSGGDIDVRSIVGEGTVFTLYLPQAEEAVIADRVIDRDDQSPDGQGFSVLVVEDNLDVGRFSTQALQDFGYETTWVTSAEEALNTLGSGNSSFDAVFSDVVMPGMGGIELAKRLAAEMPTMPVVLASGYSHVLAQEGAHGFTLVQKPYSADKIAKTLRKAIG
jgi:PAS domain S-box-containing protein